MSMSSGAAARPFAETSILADAWWVLLLRGVLAILFGILVLVWPTGSLLGLVSLYGAYACIDGLFSIASAFRSGASGRTMLVIGGLVSLVAGLTALAWPALTALVLIIILGLWSVARGGVEIVVALALRKEIRNEWMLILAGAVSVLFGVGLLVAPGLGGLFVVGMIGGWAILFGVLLVGLSFRLRSLART